MTGVELPWRVPIVSAPLAGGASTPALAAAVSAAGGLGLVAGGYLSPDGLEDPLREMDGRTDDAYGINLFLPSAPGNDLAEVLRYREALMPSAKDIGVELGDPKYSD